MGCTSSAPNTISPNANTAEKSIQFEEDINENPSIEVDVADIEDENRTNEIKVLPSCDTFEETVELVRNNKSSNSLAIEKDVPANGHVIESENMIKTPAKAQDEVKISKLELFMDKVFETNQHLSESEQKINENTNSPTDSNKVERIENNEGTDVAMEPESSNTPETEDENNRGEREKAEEASPSQSQSSRATRWEALADIAAELPPSLAVDPVTGQIYQIAPTKTKSDQ